MKKSWILYFILYIVGWIIVDYVRGIFDPFILIIRILFGVVIIYVLYKTFETPFGKLMEHARKPLDFEFIKKSKKYTEISALIAVVFIVLMIVSSIFKQYSITLFPSSQ
jgi:hypothetical protein